MPRHKQDKKNIKRRPPPAFYVKRFKTEWRPDYSRRQRSRYQWCYAHSLVPRVYYYEWNYDNSDYSELDVPCPMTPVRDDGFVKKQVTVPVK